MSQETSRNGLIFSGKNSLSSKLCKTATFGRAPARGRAKFAGGIRSFGQNVVYRESFAFWPKYGQKAFIIRKKACTFYSYTVRGKGKASKRSDFFGKKFASTKLVICVFLRGLERGDPKISWAVYPPEKAQLTMDLAIWSRSNESGPKTAFYSATKSPAPPTCLGQKCTYDEIEFQTFFF